MIITILIGIKIIHDIYKERTWYIKHKDFILNKKQYFIGFISLLLCLILLCCSIWLLSIGESSNSILLGLITFFSFIFLLPFMSLIYLKSRYIKWNICKKMDVEVNHDEYNSIVLAKKVQIGIILINFLLIIMFFYICHSNGGLPEKLEHLVETSTLF